ncbi:uncharacterized protein F5891DRAFT_1204351 [Suillus fuscotomentosus]|uniref:Uncharacterized protein n=1 Tax=Suillus fuscotomentosus TaxID=1912939 RepID=A0AAD4DP14_9AGAM|nr:uncharacterized protein F5891DRAFT_1204351 [Suillus fuscotomentosus]KAG1879946.1 hypothetical protein F5891DRAFT_1204351 [Suillus fuscotomentosus]
MATPSESSDLSTMAFATPRSSVGGSAYLGNSNSGNSDTWSTRVARATSNWSSTVMLDDDVPINNRPQAVRPNMTIADIMEAIECMRVNMTDSFNMLLTLSTANTKYAEQGVTLGIAAKEVAETSKAETMTQLQDLRAQIQRVEDKINTDERTRRWLA